MRVLVTGGAGYVGSVSVEALVAAGHDVVVLDDLGTGHRAAVVAGARLVVGSYGDAAAMRDLLVAVPIDAVLHCAARSLVGESIADPALYYRENVAGGVTLLEALREAGVRRLVFSSTAAVYGAPTVIPIREDAALAPINTVRRDEADLRGRAALVRRRLRPAQRQPPLLQRGRRLRAQRRGPRARDAPHPERPRCRRGPRRADGLRDRLPDGRRDLHPRLHPRRGPGAGAPARARGDGSRRRPHRRRGRWRRGARPEPGQRRRLQRARGARRGRRPRRASPSPTRSVRGVPATRRRWSRMQDARGRSSAGSRRIRISARSSPRPGPGAGRTRPATAHEAPTGVGRPRPATPPRATEMKRKRPQHGTDPAARLAYRPSIGVVSPAAPAAPPTLPGHQRARTPTR